LGKKKVLEDRPFQTTFKVEDFRPAEECKPCHPIYYKEWAASMHAYSMSDPVWFKFQQGAQTAHKAIGEEIGDFCIQCHSPVAALTNAITDHENLTIEESVKSSTPNQRRCYV